MDQSGKIHAKDATSIGVEAKNALGKGDHSSVLTPEDYFHLSVISTILDRL